MDIEDTQVHTSLVFFFICRDYLFSKHAYLTSMDEMTSVKINTKIKI
jgi:hypothetical protein